MDEGRVMDVPRVRLDGGCVNRVSRATSREWFWVSLVGWWWECCCRPRRRCCCRGKGRTLSRDDCVTKGF